VVGTAIRLNVEHRTPNIERRILMTLRFIDFITSEPQNFKGWNRQVYDIANKMVLIDQFLHEN